MKFIRVHGRVVPIKDGKGNAKQKSNPHATQTKLGAVAGVTSALSLGASAKGHLKTALAFGAASAVTSGVAIYKNLTNSIAHGKEKKSFLHGLGRYFTLGWAHAAGTGAGYAGATAASMGVRALKSGGGSGLRKGAINMKKLKGGGYGY